MSTQSMTIEFEGHVSKEDFEEWREWLALMLDNDGTVSVLSSEQTVSVETITEENIGDGVRFFLKDGGEVTGTLEHIFPSGRHGEVRVLVVGGQAYPMTYGVAYLASK